MKTKNNALNFESFKNYSIKNLKVIYGGTNNDDETDKTKVRFPDHESSDDY